MSVVPRNGLYRIIHHSIIAGLAVCLFTVFSVAISIINGGLTPDRATVSLMVLIIAGLLLTIRQIIMTTLLWGDMVTRLQSEFLQQHERYLELLMKYQMVQAIPDAISMVPAGWMFSLGVMNVSRHNQPNQIGPTAFLWRPDVLLKDGKVESRAVTGEGETLEQALLDAIAQANQIS